MARKKCITQFLTSCLIMLMAAGCKEEIDESARYVFKDPTIWMYLQKHEEYSEYCHVLQHTPVSKQSESSISQLLAARGNYTVFAPTNEAIHAYLQSLVEKGKISSPAWDAFPDSNLLDSIYKVIAYNSIIDGGDKEYYMTYDFPQVSNGEFGRSNMRDLKLSVFYVTDPDSIYINRTCPVNGHNRDIRTLNGAIHQMEKVIAPDERTLAELMASYMRGDAEGFLVMAKLCEACGLMDTLSKVRDEVYENLYQRGIISPRTPAGGLATMDGGYSYAPEHRKYGFTIFAEPDSFWTEKLNKQPRDITPADVQEWVAQQGFYPEAVASTDYTSPGNLLYQWTTYHVIPFKLSPSRLTFHYCELGYDYVSNPLKYTIPVMEYYVTMGKRRLLKIYESPESDGIYLNRFPIIDNRRRGTGHEIGCDADKLGVRVFKEDPTLEARTTVNGFMYRIDSPIAYDEATRNNLGRQRIRMDCMSWFPEAMNNDIRRVSLTDAPHQWVHFPCDTEYKYLDNLSINEGSNFVYYNVYGYGFGSYCGDEVKCVGRWELMFKLPPVPRRGTYEVRYRVLSNENRGVAQLYFGDDPNNLPVTGIPIDLTMGGEDPRTGWREDIPNDDAYNDETDKQMHSKGYMKGELSIYRKNASANSRENASSRIVRHIVTRRTLDPDKTYYIKFKTVLDRTTAEFYMDGLEYCPKEIYDNPNEPEDIW